MTWHYNWTAGYNALNQQEREDNATEIYNLLTNTYGFTAESASAVISNFEHEGELNPGQWQHGSTIGDWNNDYVGLGLGQWTPPNKIGSYCGGNTESAVCNGDKQVECTVTQSGQWVQRVNSSGYSNYYSIGGIPYITSISEFSQSTLDPEDLATCWCACWEGCSRKAFRDSYNIRRQDARKWYNFFGGTQGGYPIHITNVGNGYGEASINERIVTRAEAGETVRIDAVPYDNDYFVIWTADYPSSLQIVDVTSRNTTFVMPASKVDLTATFTGETPPTPPPYPPQPVFGHAKRHKMPIWMYPQFRI